jgi:hypothetical protein
MGFAANMEQEKSEWILIYVLAALAHGTGEFGRCPGSRCSLEKAKGSNGLESFSMNVVKFLSGKCAIGATTFKNLLCRKQPEQIPWLPSEKGDARLQVG